MLSHRVLRFAVQWILTVGSVSCLDPSRQHVKRDLESVEAEYDYIIVGGGTSGLVVASRLSEDPHKSVLVVEYGDFADTINVTIPFFSNREQPSMLFQIPSAPQTHLAGRTWPLRVGKAVGGGSVVNGMAWDRGSASDYDSWEGLGNPAWGWDTLLKYFRKSSRFSPPADEYVEQYGYEWTPDAYGTGPIHVGYPAWQWPVAELQARAWVEDLDAAELTDGADGKNVGVAWMAHSLDGRKSVRSTSETAYYQPVSHRANLHLLVRHYGAGVKFEGNMTTGVEVASLEGKNSKFVSSKNVILAAGAVNTPRILQLSGIGPAKLLKSLDIDLVVDAPGVGANFQDHPRFFMSHKFNNNTKINADLMEDPKFYDAAWEEYVTNKTGPFTHTWLSRVVFDSLQDLDPKFESIADSLDDQEPLAHLPPIYAENPSLVKGFVQQRKITQSRFRNSQAGVMEYALTDISQGGEIPLAIGLQKPLSRGTIMINSTNPDPSIPLVVDFQSVSNPVDILLLIRGFQRTRKFMGSQTMASLEPVEVSPGPSVDDSSDVDVEKALRETLLIPSFDHPAGTAAMMPREWGGVVDAKLRVYGVEGLWVVDASMMPLLPAAHTQATVYAVAEYAAELIQGYGKNEQG